LLARSDDRQYDKEWGGACSDQKIPAAVAEIEAHCASLAPPNAEPCVCNPFGLTGVSGQRTTKFAVMTLLQSR
jgi:hypothetical protein